MAKQQIIVRIMQAMTFLLKPFEAFICLGVRESEKFLGFTDDEVEIMINTDNISMIEMPLHKVEDVIVQGLSGNDVGIEMIIANTKLQKVCLTMEVIKWT